MSLYALYEPQGGARALERIESEWNEGLTKDQSYCIAPRNFFKQEYQPLSRFEGGGTPDGLGKTGFVLYGMNRAEAIVRFDNWQVSWVKSTAEVKTEEKRIDVEELPHFDGFPQYVIYFDPERLS